MVVGLLGNESSDSDRITLATLKSENDVRLRATLGSQNPTGLPVGAVSVDRPTFQGTFMYPAEISGSIVYIENVGIIY